MKGITIRAKSSIGHRKTNSMNPYKTLSPTKINTIITKKSNIVLTSPSKPSKLPAFSYMRTQSACGTRKKYSTQKISIARTANATPTTKNQPAKIVLIEKPQAANKNHNERRFAFENLIEQLKNQAEESLKFQNCLNIKKLKSAQPFPNNFMSSKINYVKADDFGTCEVLSRILYRKIYREPFHISRTRSDLFYKYRTQNNYQRNTDNYKQNDDLYGIVTTQKVSLEYPQRPFSPEKKSRNFISPRKITTAPTLFNNQVLNEGVNKKNEILPMQSPIYARSMKNKSSHSDRENTESEEILYKQQKLAPKFNNVYL